MRSRFLFRPVLLGVVFATVVTGMAMGHHGWSEYDGENALTLKGVIRAYGYENPHC